MPCVGFPSFAKKRPLPHFLAIGGHAECAARNFDRNLGSRNREGGCLVIIEDDTAFLDAQQVMVESDERVAITRFDSRGAIRRGLE